MIAMLGACEKALVDARKAECNGATALQSLRHSSIQPSARRYTLVCMLHIVLPIKITSIHLPIPMRL